MGAVEASRGVALSSPVRPPCPPAPRRRRGAMPKDGHDTTPQMAPVLASPFFFFMLLFYNHSMGAS